MPPMESVAISGHSVGGAGGGRGVLQLLGLELPVQIANVGLEVVAHGQGDVQGHGELQIAAGGDGPQLRPIRQLSRLMGRGIEKGGGGSLHRQGHLREKFLGTGLGPQRAQVQPHPVVTVISQTQGLGQPVAGHDALKVREQIGGGIVAAGKEHEALSVAVIGDGAGVRIGGAEA